MRYVDAEFVGVCGVGAFPGCDTTSTGAEENVGLGHEGGTEAYGFWWLVVAHVVGRGAGLVMGRLGLGEERYHRRNRFGLLLRWL